MAPSASPVQNTARKNIRALWGSTMKELSSFPYYP